MEQAKLLRIHIGEGDSCKGEPLYKAIVSKCRELGMAGATVFRGLEGYGETAEIHRKHLLAADQPIIVVVVDSAERIDSALPVLESLLDTGMMAVSPVEMKRVRRNSGNQDRPARI